MAEACFCIQAAETALRPSELGNDGRLPDLRIVRLVHRNRESDYLADAASCSLISNQAVLLRDKNQLQRAVGA